MTLLSTTTVALGDRSYDILIGPGLLESEQAYAGLKSAEFGLVVTNEVVNPIHGAKLRSAIAQRHRRVETCVLPDGEAFKDLLTLNKVFDHLLRAGADRKTVVYALGGGVIGDMAGFAAACYMRGVPFVQLPTTLLAQVDSSVGGKTAVNHALGKNMIGAFYQPERVICDLSTLLTLPEREYLSGLAEVIKYGAMADREFLDWLSTNISRLRTRDVTALSYAVKRSCEIKADVVAADEREAGIRAHLNLGHTFGHAIETGMGYGAWLHGEAVAAGMVMATDLSVRLGLLGASDGEYLRSVIDAAGLPVAGPKLGVAEYLRHMAVDKKAEGGHIRFVVLTSLGTARVQTADDAVVVDVLRRAGAC